MTPSSEPRVAPLPFAQWDEHARSVLLPYLRRPELYLSGAPDAPPMPVVLELLAHHLPLSASWLPFTAMLAGGDAKLRPEHRELLILRVAWRTHSGYEWTQHVRSGKETGLTEAQVDAIPLGPSADVWTPIERALLAAVDEMIDGFAVREETWSTLGAFFDSPEILELLFVIGGYLCLAGVLNSIGLQSDLPTQPARQGPADEDAP
jgi:4-carboxymuconolactone decarboxylase